MMFPSIQDFLPDQLNELRNVMTLAVDIHPEFSEFIVAFDPVKDLHDRVS